MDKFFEIALGLPTAIFTTLLLISLGYWIITLVSGIDQGPDLDLEVDVEGDFDIESSSSMLAALGLHQVPLSLVFTVVSLTGWVVSMLLVHLLSETGNVSLFVGLAIALGAIVAGLAVASPVAHLLAPLFAVNAPVHHSDLIGRECIVRTGRVDQEFGQAEVTDHEHGTHIVQVRATVPNDLEAGSIGHLIDVDGDGGFRIEADLMNF